MVKWKIFDKSKTKREENIQEPQIQPEQQITQEPPQENMSEEKIVDLEEKPIAEHHEILQTGVSTSKSKPISHSESVSDQRIWRDVDSIENNVDKLHVTNNNKPISELDKKVDKLISKKEDKHRKPSNVIYVVSKPQPGQVKGDWAVRSHGKIFSHHRTKENAIKAARKVARDRNATVMVQNTDGTFSDGFKPRPKK